MDTNAVDIDLSGQVALVTGGGRGLGRAAALALADAGMRVVVAARSTDEIAETVTMIQSTGGTALALPCDVSDPASVDAMTEQVIREYGKIDLLVNNAGIMAALGPLWETDVQAWKQVLDINLYGCYLCARAALKDMVARRAGRIINVGSGASLAPIARGSAYCTAKAALTRLTECIVEDAGEYGITAFTIAPGNVLTAMTEYLMYSDAGREHTPWFEELMKSGGESPPEMFTELVTLVAAGKADTLSGRFLAVWQDVNQMIENAEAIGQGEMYVLRLKELPSETKHESETIA